MFEIAGGILLAIVILIVVLATFGRIIVALSALATVGLVVAGAVLSIVVTVVLWTVGFKLQK